MCKVGVFSSAARDVCIVCLGQNVMTIVGSTLGCHPGADQLTRGEGHGTEQRDEEWVEGEENQREMLKNTQRCKGGKEK